MLKFIQNFQSHYSCILLAREQELEGHLNLFYISDGSHAWKTPAAQTLAWGSRGSGVKRGALEGNASPPSSESKPQTLVGSLSWGEPNRSQLSRTETTVGREKPYLEKKYYLNPCKGKKKVFPKV